MIDGIILAGGYSSRLGKNKMSIIYQDKPVIIHTILNMKSVCNQIYVITGHYHKQIKELIRNINGIRIVYNENYNLGMFTSVLAGVEMINNDFFLIPGDYPLVSANIYNKLLLGSKSIRVPSFNYKLGHPIFFKKKYKSLLLNTECDNLKAFRNQYDYEIVDVNDSAILFDIDTIEDVNRLKNKE
ncbi:MAG: nucleotidyltransferase family protein [Bacillota bacterium]